MNKIPKAQGKGGVEPLFIIVILLAILMGGVIYRYLQPTIVEVKVARFWGGAEAAYSIIHDDLCAESGEGIITNADTMAFNRDIRFGTGAIVSNCVEGGDTLWEQVQVLVEHGHEILAHSWDHGSAIELGWEPLSWSHDTDVVLTKKILEDNLNNVEITWFVFPYDAYNEKRLEELRSAGYLGARAGDSMFIDRSVNGRLKNFDPLKTHFDIYMSQEEQEAILASDDPYKVSIYPNMGTNVAIQHINAALSVGGWSVQEMHTVADVEDSIWGSITEEEYRHVLDYCVAKRDSGKLWIETPTKVASYIVTRNGLGSAKIAGDKILFPQQELNKKYLYPVTLMITTKNAPDTLWIMQDGVQKQALKVSSNHFKYTYMPGSSLQWSFKK